MQQSISKTQTMHRGDSTFNEQLQTLNTAETTSIASLVVLNSPIKGGGKDPCRGQLTPLTPRSSSNEQQGNMKYPGYAELLISIFCW